MCIGVYEIVFVLYMLALLAHHSFYMYNRLWTKGYDVYTPSKIVLVIDNSDVPQLIGDNGDGESHEKEHFDPLQWLRNGMVWSEHIFIQAFIFYVLYI